MYQICTVQTCLLHVTEHLIEMIQYVEEIQKPRCAVLIFFNTMLSCIMLGSWSYKNDVTPPHNHLDVVSILDQ